MAQHLNGLGSQGCIEVTSQGRACPNLEVDGMDFCLKHMPPELLDEAEQITGVRRCLSHPDDPFMCREYAEPGSVPPACKAHKQTARKAGMHLRSVAADRASELVAEFESSLENPEPLTDVFGELLAVAAEMRAWKDILRSLVAELERKYRYSGKAGEQTRAEVLLYSQALRDLAGLLRDISKLDIDARLLGVRQQTLNMLTRALDASLEAGQVPLDRQVEARKVFQQKIRVVA